MCIRDRRSWCFLVLAASAAASSAIRCSSCITSVSYTHLNRGTSQDLKAVSEALSYLRQKGLSTVEDLEAFLESSGKSAADYRNQMKPKEARSKVIDGILASRTDCKECKPVRCV